MSKEEATVVLMRVEETSTPVDGSVKITAGCGCECWMAPDVASSIIDPDATYEFKTTCGICMGYPSTLAAVMAKLLEGAAGMMPSTKETLDREYDGLGGALEAVGFEVSDTNKAS